MKRFIAVALAFVLVIMTLFTSCTASEQKSSDKKKIVVTNFSEYDWVRNIVGSTEGFEITMLGGGVDLHSFQPSAADIVTITQSDLFIYVGGESDRWVGDVLNSSKNENMEIIALMEIPGVHTRTEEYREGMQAEHEDEDEDEEEEEYDEHVWLSLKNAVVFCENIESILEKLDPDNTDTFRTNLTLMMYMEKQAFAGSYAYDKASAASLILLAIYILFSSVIYFTLIRDRDEARLKKLNRQKEKELARSI